MTSLLIRDLLIVLAAGLVAGLACRCLKLSVLVGYLFVGALIGGLRWVVDESHEIGHLAEAGVFLLLFTIGLEFSFSELKNLGRELVIGGASQMLLVAAPVAFLTFQLGVAWQAALLIGCAVAFSSTVLVFQVLSERGHNASPHGRRAIGILLFQDAALIPLLLLVPLLTQGAATASAADYAKLALTSIAFVAAVALARELIVKSIVPQLASFRTPEMIVLFTVVLLGGITYAAHLVGLPPAVGAFAAGLVLGANRWTRQIDALILPFRETFAVVFFVSLGLLFDARLVLREPALLVVSFCCLVALKAAGATLALRLTGLSWQAAGRMGAGLAHVGEFAFVLMLLGYERGVIAEPQYQAVVGVGILSLMLSPILLRWALAGIELSDVVDVQDRRSAPLDLPVEREAVVVGAGAIGRRVCSHLETTGFDVCLVDLSHLNVHEFGQAGFRTVVGDATEDATLHNARVAHASLLVVCVPHDETAARIVRAMRRLSPHSTIVVRCRFQSNCETLVRDGANQVVSEEIEAGRAILAALSSEAAPQ